jgi:putative membrane protein
MNKKIFATAALALGWSLLAAAADNPDAAFYKAAAEGGLSEVEQGRLAQQKSASEDVKTFGAMMVKDHSAANEKLKTIAVKNNITLPTSSSMAQMAAKAKLEVLTGDTFDKSYIKGMVEDHEEDIKAFQKEATNGQDPDAKAFAAAALPTLKKHLKSIQAIAGTHGIKAS